MRAVGLAVLAIAAGGPALAETCAIFPRCNVETAVSCIFAEVRNLTFSIRSGEACTYNFKVDGAMELEDMAVSRRPRSGQAGRANRFEIAYRAKPGHAGPDDFAVTFSGNVSGRRFTHTFEIAVTVTP